MFINFSAYTSVVINSVGNTRTDNIVGTRKHFKVKNVASIYCNNKTKVRSNFCVMHNTLNKFRDITIELETLGGRFALVLIELFMLNEICLKDRITKFQPKMFQQGG